MYQTVVSTQFGKCRYSRDFGARFPELWFDCLPYVDLMLKDLGVRKHQEPAKEQLVGKVFHALHASGLYWDRP